MLIGSLDRVDRAVDVVEKRSEKIIKLFQHELCLLCWDQVKSMVETEAKLIDADQF